MDFSLLKRLCLLGGVSGDEGSVSKVIFEEIKDYATEITTDNLGNLIVFKKGKSKAKHKLMLSAHMDEVGFIVTDITDDGFIKFDEVGGIDRRVVPGCNVLINHNVNGIIGMKPIHLCSKDEQSAIPPYSDMYIDIGASNKQESLDVVSLGDSICFDSFYFEDDICVKTKALDDRLGCCILTQMIKSTLPYDMYFAFVVQEEVGLRGAKVAAYTINPEYSIVLESTTAADIPQNPKEKQVCALGEGAVVGYMDKSTIYDKELVNKCKEISQSNGYKLQIKRAVAGGNDAGAINASRCGVRTIAISAPCRYLHSQMSLIYKSDADDVYNITKQLAKIIAGDKL